MVEQNKKGTHVGPGLSAFRFHLRIERAWQLIIIHKRRIWHEDVAIAAWSVADGRGDRGRAAVRLALGGQMSGLGRC